MTIAILPVREITGVGSLSNMDEFKSNCLRPMRFDDMISTQFRTDAHYVQYSIPELPQWPRLRKGILPEIIESGMRVVLSYFSFDWDNAEHSPWDASGIKLFEEKLMVMTNHPILAHWHTLYATKGGARIVYKPQTPMAVDVAEEHILWLLEQFRAAGFAVGTSIPEAHIDASCRDWTRCFRCPQVHRNDGSVTWEQPYFRLFQQKAVLDNTIIGRIPIETVARTNHFDKAKHAARPIPDYNTSQTQLQTMVNGKAIWTDFYKRSRRVLKDSPYFDIIYNNAATGWEHGGRNDNIMKLIGTITPILLKKAYASVNQIFALLYAPLLTLGSDQDWPAHAWNALLDVYERENNKYNIEKEKEAEKERVELNYLDKIVEGMKEWNTHPDLYINEDVAREYARSRAIVSCNSYFFTIGTDGYYGPSPMMTNQIISRIRKSHLADIIPTAKPSITGEMADMTPATIQNSYSTCVTEIQMKPVGDKGGFIVDIDGDKPKLILSTYCRNRNLVARYDEYVDGWLKALGGEKYYDTLCQWIGNALAFEEGLICAISLEGASNAGKKLLTQGLAECLKEPITAGPLDIYGKSSAFIKTPFLVINESWPDQRGAGLSPADTFKSLLGGDGIRVEEKFKPAMMVLNPIRMILTANDDGIIRTLTKDKDMNPDNRKAIGDRLFHFRVGPADKYLKELGGMGFTAKAGSKWIRPDSGMGDGDFVVARHFLWLHQNRKPVDPTNRFLVMGNSAPGCGGDGLTVFEKQLTDNKKTPIVASAIIQMLDHKAQDIWKKGYVTDPGTGQLWVTRASVHNFIKQVMDERLSEHDIYSSLTNILEKTEPDKDDLGTSWYEINVEMLLMAASEWGHTCIGVRNLVAQRKRFKAS